MSRSSLPKLTDLVSLRTLQRLQDNFAEALGISAHIIDLEGKELTQGRFNSEFLAKNCRSTGPGAMRAIEKQRTYIYECQQGVFTFSTPIMVEGAPIGLVKGGQVRLGNPDLKECRFRAEEIGVTFDYYLEEYLKLPLFTRERLEASAELLRLVASTISSMAYSGLSAEEEIQNVLYMNDLLEAEVKRKTRDLELTHGRYRSLVDNAEDVIYTVDSKGIITSINPAVLKITGYEPREVLGNHFKQFVFENDFEKVNDSFKQIFKGSKIGTSGLEFRVYHRNGGVRWVELNSRAIRDDSGELIEIEGILRDITSTHETDQAIQASELKYRLLFEHSSEPIFLLSRSGICLNMNSAMASFLGYSDRSEIEGRSGMDFIPKEFQDDYRNVVMPILHDPQFTSDASVIVLLTKEGTYAVADVSFTRITDDLYMGILWHKRQRISELTRKIVKHPHSKKIFELLKKR